MYLCQKSCAVKLYIISCYKKCDNDCRAGYCNTCKICLHKYICQCFENSVKTILCKHIYAVARFEHRREFVLGPTVKSKNHSALCINKPLNSLIHYQEDLENFIGEKCGSNMNPPINNF